MSPSPVYLVTGAAGFIASQFIESCKYSVAVIGVDDAARFSSRSQFPDAYCERIVDRGALFHWLPRENPALDAIIHLGACTDTTSHDEACFHKWNFQYSQWLWQYASKKRIPFIYASSAATYGNGELGFSDDESHIERLRPLNPYARSKHVFDLWALAQERAGMAPPSWAGLKFFNVYGSGEQYKGIMASMVLQAFDQINQRGQVRLFKSCRGNISDGGQSRDFIYVKDVVTVIHFLLKRPPQRGIFNVGTGEARTFLDLVRIVFEKMERSESIEFIDMPPHLQSQYQYSTVAAIGRLRRAGYRARFVPLEVGARLYVSELLKEAQEKPAARLLKMVTATTPCPCCNSVD